MMPIFSRFQGEEGNSATEINLASRLPKQPLFWERHPTQGLGCGFDPMKFDSSLLSSFLMLFSTEKKQPLSPPLQMALKIRRPQCSEEAIEFTGNDISPALT